MNVKSLVLVGLCFVASASAGQDDERGSVTPSRQSFTQSPTLSSGLPSVASLDDLKFLQNIPVEGRSAWFQGLAGAGRVLCGIDESAPWMSTEMRRDLISGEWKTKWSTPRPGFPTKKNN